MVQLGVQIASAVGEGAIVALKIREYLRSC